VHPFDLVLSDRPMPTSLNGRGVGHRLVSGGVTLLATAPLARKLRGSFPASLDGAPMLLPGGDSALRDRLLAWLDTLRVRPKVVGDFDDNAVMRAFVQAGAGVFPMPTMVAAETATQFHVQPVGQTDDVLHEVYAVSAERGSTNPTVVAIREAAAAVA
jgi:LysR family transcriptional activator of nhaA